MGEVKITDYTALTTPDGDDLLEIVDDVAGTPTSKKITVDNLFGGADQDYAGNYALQLQNIPDLVSKGAGYYSGSSANISLADHADLDPDDGDVAYEFLVNVGGLSVNIPFVHRYINVSNYCQIIRILSTDNLEFTWIVGGVILHKAVVTDWIPAAYSEHHIVWSLENGVSNTVYIDGKLQSLSTDTHTGGTLALAKNLDINRNSRTTMRVFREFNLKFSAAEVKALSSGAPMPYKYIGASQISIITGDNSDMDTVGNWIGVGATLTGGYDSGDAGHDNTLRVESNDAANNNAVLTQAHFDSTLIVGKKFHLSLDYKFINAPSIDTPIFLGNATFDNLDKDASTWTSYKYEFIALDISTALTIYVCAGGGSADNELLLDNVQIKQIGCVLQLEQPGIGHNQWLDTSGNELHGTVSGALPTNLPANHIEKYIDLAVTANTTFTLPKGYMISAILVRETAGNAITGGLDVGYSEGSAEIVNAMAVGANAEVNCTLISTGVLGANFDDASDVIHIAATTNWNSASIKIRVIMNKVI